MITKFFKPMNSLLLPLPEAVSRRRCLSLAAISVHQWFLLLFLLFAASASAQWDTTTYTLKGGWNSIYLHGDATYASMETLFPNSGDTANVLEVWRWNPNPTQVQFTESPLIPSAGTPDWSVWVRGGGANTLSSMPGQTAYLVRCSGTTSNTYSVPITQSPLPPRASWVRNGANFMGFPTKLTGTYPSFNNYFATFPAAVASNTKIYKYVGGELGPNNPLLIFSTSFEKLDRNQAYWFSAEVVGNFYAPLEISLSVNDGLAFGLTRDQITMRVRNRTSGTVTLTLTPFSSEPAPASQPGLTGSVPLTRGTYPAQSLELDWNPITGANNTVDIGPQSTVEVYLGVARSHASMTGASDAALFASFLKLNDSGNLMEVLIPASAQKASKAGLWVGDVSVTNVGSQVTNAAKATATVTNGVVTAVTVSGSGGYGYSSAPTVTIADPESGSTATATATIAAGSVTGFTLGSGGSGYAIASPQVTVDPPPPLPGTTTPQPFQLRTLLHVSDDASPVARLLSQVFLGQLSAGGNPVGLCTQESLLKQDAKAEAQRLVAAHLPLDQVITGSGTVETALTCTVTLPYNDKTNPFVHQYHPDHDNKDARSQPLGAGVESYDITRTCTFTFSATPPSGSTTPANQWGSSVIGGTYSETITGLHRQTIQLNGTFELRRASEIGTLTIQ